MASKAIELPTLLVVADQSGAAIAELFARRGFAASVLQSFDEVQARLALAVPSAAIVDFELPGAADLVALLVAAKPRPAIVGIAAADRGLEQQELLDGAFLRPVDPARLYTRVVFLVAERRGKGRRAARLTGIVAVVRGNELFHLVERELHGAVPPVNAGAILEKALRDLGSDPKTLEEGDLAAIVASGRLEDALRVFGEPDAIRAALERIRALLAGEGPTTGS